MTIFLYRNDHGAFDKYLKENFDRILLWFDINDYLCIKFYDFYYMS